jgi:hypothetical protein
MDQPQIRDALITRLYRLAKALYIPMTGLVNPILEHGMVRIEHGAEHGAKIATTASRHRPQRKGKPHAETA